MTNFMAKDLEEINNDYLNAFYFSNDWKIIECFTCLYF